MPVEIKILENNKYCQIDNLEASLVRRLDKLLSYKEPGIEFSPACQYGWNGVNKLLSKKNQFPIGLLDMTREFLSQNQIEFTVIDQRRVVENSDPLDISKRLAEMKMVPRYYQIDAVKAALENRQGIIKVCTGGGKTLIAAILVAALNKPTNIYVIGLDLLQQFHDLFSSIFNEKIGYVGNGVCEIRRINVVSLWTAAKSLDPKKKIKASDDEDDKEQFNESNCFKIQKMIKDAKVILFDECHSGSTESFKRIYSSINPENIYGMSATPYKGETTDLLIKALLGNVIVNIPASELIEKNYLVKPIIRFFEVPKMHIENRTYVGVYKEYIVENVIRNRMIIDSTKKLVENGFQTLVLFRQISHGKKLFEMLLKEGVQVEMLSGKDKLETRMSVKEKLLSGELRCVISSSIYDTGVDISSLNGLVLASPNKSLVRALQRIGRVIRTHPGKSEVRVVDFIDNALYLKAHSKRRYGIYSNEKGFVIQLPKGIKL